MAGVLPPLFRSREHPVSTDRRDAARQRVIYPEQTDLMLADLEFVPASFRSGAQHRFLRRP